MTGGQPDLVAIFEALTRHEVEYVLVGGAAALMHGASRPTEDVDVMARAGLENLTRLANALNSLGATHNGFPLDADDLRSLNTRWDTNAGRVDVLTTALGAEGRVTYRDLVDDRELFTGADLAVPVVSIDRLIEMKQAAGRPKDRAAIDELRRLRDD